MIPLYNQEEFNSAKSRQLLPLQCTQCNKTFFKPKHRIQEGLSPKRKDRLNFCGYTCSSMSFNTSLILKCEHCGKEFKKCLAQINKTKHHFCSKSCSCTYSNTHKTTGTRVSKLEKWLATKLPSLYPALEFHFNRKDAINSELDIYIPNLKLAFELNGIFHYEPIFGDKALERSQNNDKRKYQACIEQGIELCIIDVSKQKYFKEQTCLPFLEIIQGIILLKLSRVLTDPIPETT